MLNILEQKIQLTDEEELLAFFAEKFELSDDDGHFNVKSLMLAIYEWWFAPRTKVLQIKMLAKSSRIANVHSQTGALPKYFFEAFALAQNKKYQTYEALHRAYNLGGWGLWFKIALFFKVTHMIPDSTATYK